MGDKIKVNRQGWITLLDILGTDHSIAEAARTSFGKTSEDTHADEKLIRYLMRHRHTSPFEMAELVFGIYVPMDTWRQFVRHRTASINEYSTRYSIAIDEMHKAESWRLQSKNNKQGSDGELEGTISQTLSEAEESFQSAARDLYMARVNVGVAREQARKDLPLSTYTRAVWKIDLHNLLHFLKLRLAPDAQTEIRQYAEKIAEVVKEHFPYTWAAFEEYELNSITFSRTEIKLLPNIICKTVVETISKMGLPFDLADVMESLEARINQFTPESWQETQCRERNEFYEKLLGIIPEITPVILDE